MWPWVEKEKRSGRNVKFRQGLETKDYHSDVLPTGPGICLPQNEMTTIGTEKIIWHRTWPWILGGLLLAYFYAYFAAMSSGDVDLAECHALEAAVVERNVVPPSVSAPRQPGIFCDRAIQMPFLRRYEKVFVYGVTDRAAQDGIVASVKEFRAARKGVPLVVEFFEKENWITWSDGNGKSGGRRGKEIAVREDWVR
jgi:hypothetical protein